MIAAGIMLVGVLVGGATLPSPSHYPAPVQIVPVRADQAEQAPPGEVLYELPSMAAYLAPDERYVFPRLYFGVTLLLENADSEARIDSRLPRLVDALNTFLVDLSESELRGAGGTEVVRRYILNELIKIVPASSVLDLYFREFVVR